MSNAVSFCMTYLSMSLLCACACAAQCLKQDHSVRYHTLHLQLCLHCSSVWICFHPLWPFLPLSTARRLWTVVMLILRPAAPHAHAPAPGVGGFSTPGRGVDTALWL